MLLLHAGVIKTPKKMTKHIIVHSLNPLPIPVISDFE
jgi:hypothetical protein